MSVTRGCYHVRHEPNEVRTKSTRQNVYINSKNRSNQLNIRNCYSLSLSLSLSLSSSLLSLFLFLLCNKKNETLSHRPLANIQIKDVLTSPRLVHWRIQRLCQCSLLTPRRRWTLVLFHASPSRHILKLSQPRSRLIRTYTRKTPTRE